jgi:hypothetical protein
LTLHQLLEEINGLDDCYVVYKNNIRIDRKHYQDILLGEKDIIVIKSNVHGGEGKSNPVMVIAQIGLLATAFGAPGALGLAAGSFGAAAASAVVSIGGNLILNALLPPAVPQPHITDSNVSPTYAISGIKNQARIGSSIPICVGRNKIVCDLSAKYYSEWVGNDQYAYGLFTVCLNDVSISDIRMGNDDIGNFQDVEYEISDGTGEVTLFSTDVDTFSVNNDCLTPQQQTSNDNTTKLTVNFSGTLAKYLESGERGTAQIAYQVQYRKQGGDPTWIDFPDASAFGLWAVETNILTSTQYNRGISVDLSSDPGIYEVRVARRTPAFKSDRFADSIVWSTLQAYQIENQSGYNFQRRLAVKLKASGGVQGDIDAVNLIAHSKF